MTGGVESAEDLSLSLFYYKEGGGGRSTNREYGNLDKPRGGSSSGSLTLETLDLIVPNSKQYKELLSAIQDMLSTYRKIKARTDSTTLLLEYLWIDMGKNLNDTLSHSEWIEICEQRLHVPLKKSIQIGRAHV